MEWIFSCQKSYPESADATRRCIGESHGPIALRASDVFGTWSQWKAALRGGKLKAYEELGWMSAPRIWPSDPAGVSCSAGVNCSPRLDQLTAGQISGLPDDFVDALPSGQIEDFSSANSTASQAQAWDARLTSQSGRIRVGARWLSATNAVSDQERVNEIAGDIHAEGNLSILFSGFASRLARPVGGGLRNAATRAFDFAADPLGMDAALDDAFSSTFSELAVGTSNGQNVEALFGIRNAGAAIDRSSYQAALGLSGNSEIGPGVLRAFAKRTGSSTYVDVFGPAPARSYNAFPTKLGRFLNNAERIHFNLRGMEPADYRRFLKYPYLTPGNVTNWELKYLLENSALRAKTTFYDGLTGAALKDPPAWTKP